MERAVTPLAELAQRIEDVEVAAWLDVRTGEVLEQQTTRDDSFVSSSLDAATEMMRTRERPPRMVLLSKRHVHIVHRTTKDPHRVLVVIMARSPNLGMALALVRQLAETAA